MRILGALALILVSFSLVHVKLFGFVVSDFSVTIHFRSVCAVQADPMRSERENKLQTNETHGSGERICTVWDAVRAQNETNRYNYAIRTIKTKWLTNF